MNMTSGMTTTGGGKNCEHKRFRGSLRQPPAKKCCCADVDMAQRSLAGRAALQRNHVRAIGRNLRVPTSSLVLCAVVVFVQQSVDLFLVLAKKIYGDVRKTAKNILVYTNSE